MEIDLWGGFHVKPSGNLKKSGLDSNWGAYISSKTYTWGMLCVFRFLASNVPCTMFLPVASCMLFPLPTMSCVLPHLPLPLNLAASFSFSGSEQRELSWPLDFSHPWFHPLENLMQKDQCLFSSFCIRFCLLSGSSAQSTHTWLSALEG